MELLRAKIDPTFVSMMVTNNTDSQKRYGKGSTEYHAAFPPQTSDGRSGGVPRGLITPPLRKLAVLATGFPEPSQGTPGTAISATRNHPGTALPRQQCGDGDAELSPATGRKALARRVKVKVKQWQAKIHRYYLARMRKYVALTTKRAFRSVRLIAFIIGVLRRLLFRKSALPYGIINRIVHNRRFALFRRRAVYVVSVNRFENTGSPQLVLGERRPSQPMTD